MLAILRFIWHSTVLLGIGLVGGTVTAAGVVMLITPGPGLVVIIAGLAILSTQFAWAARALEKVKQRAIAARDKAVVRRAGRRADAAGPGPEDPTRRPAASTDPVEDPAVNDSESAPLNPPTDIRSAETPPENRATHDTGGAESWAGSDTQATG